jgi:SNF2 family DNA or RNA helicase
VIEVNPKRFTTPPFRHQIDGTKAVVRNRAFALFDEMGSGKSKQVIDAAGILFEAGEVDAVVLVAPASVRSVWLDPELGQIKRHSWVPTTVIEYHAKLRLVWTDSPSGSHGHGRDLPWFVTNYEFVRHTKKDTSRRDELIERLRPFSKIFLVLDESSAIKERTSKQTKAIAELRKLAVRCVVLNGTPGKPLDLWSQFEILDRHILGRAYDNFWHYRAAIAELKTERFNGRAVQLVVGFRKSEIERVQRLTRPYCLRRLKKDCLDLPPKIGGIESKTPMIREVKLSKETWRRYRQLRTEALLMIPNRDTILEANAAVRVIRLAQLTSGHVSYIPELGVDDAQGELFVENQIEYLSSEKLDDTVTQLLEWSSAEATIVWCRWRPERERLVKLLDKHGVKVFELYGGQRKADRAEAERAFAPESRGIGRRVLVAQPQAGGLGLQLHAATENIYQSNTPGLKFRLQSEDRSHRSGTIAPVTYLDVLATGPEGQKTMDHLIFKALREDQQLAAWTCSKWRKALEAE